MSTDDIMRDADVANGENPDEANRQPEDGPESAQPDPQKDANDPESESVPTGERQADENRENDPPA